MAVCISKKINSCLWAKKVIIANIIKTIKEVEKNQT